MILGDVKDTVPGYRPALPIGFISFDLDYYSSTLAALQVVEGDDWTNFLPRINAYFDDLRTIEWVGERQAITEWNARHEDRKVGQVKGSGTRSLPVQPGLTRCSKSICSNIPCMGRKSAMPIGWGRLPTETGPTHSCTYVPDRGAFVGAVNHRRGRKRNCGAGPPLLLTDAPIAASIPDAAVTGRCSGVEPESNKGVGWRGNH